MSRDTYTPPAQVMLAVRWKIPAILLIRDPIEAVCSATVFLGHTDPLPLLRFYNIYYGSLVDYQNAVVVSDFPRTTRDFNSVITAVNERYQRAFEPYVKTPENEARVEEMIRNEHRTNMDGRVGTLPLPSPERVSWKKQVFEQLSQRRYAASLNQAQELYAHFRAVALA